MTAVTRGSPRRYLRKNCAQLPANAAAHVGSGLAMHGAEQPAAAERQRGQNSRFHFGGARQDTLFGFAVVERIIDLHEIRLLAGEHGLERGEGAVIRRRDADVATHALLLPFAETRQRLIGIVDIVQLQKIELRGFQALKRAIEFDVVRRFELGGDEQLFAQTRRRRDLAKHDLGVAVRGGGVDQTAAVLDERADHGGRLLARFCVVGIEHFGGAEPDAPAGARRSLEWRG